MSRLNIEKMNYPSIWANGLETCIPNERGFDPADPYPGRKVPLEVVKEWFDLGTAKELSLYRYGNTFALEYKYLRFDTEGNEMYGMSRSEWLNVSSEDDAIAMIKNFGLYDEYRRRYSENGYLNW